VQSDALLKHDVRGFHATKKGYRISSRDPDRPASSAQPPKGGGMNKKKFAISGESIRDLVPSRAGALATDRIMVDGAKIGYMYRELSERPEDSGWRFFSGDESQEYIDDPSHTGVYAVNTIANYDPDIIPYLNAPAPCAFEKMEGKSTYQKVEQ